MKLPKIFSAKRVLTLLLLSVPLALLERHVFHASAIWVFVTSAAAIIPLAGLMGLYGASTSIRHRKFSL